MHIGVIFRMMLSDLFTEGRPIQEVGTARFHSDVILINEAANVIELS